MISGDIADLGMRLEEETKRLMAGVQQKNPRHQNQPAARRTTCDRGRWVDNVFVERLWRSLKYECVYLRAFETESEPRATEHAKEGGQKAWIALYDARRLHS